MSWVTIIWAMLASACLTLALIHGFVWWRQRTAWANLLFALMAVGTAGLAAGELAMMEAETATAFGTAMRLAHLPVWVIVVSMTGFVRLYLNAGRRWLAWSVCGLRSLALLLNFTVGQNINYWEITGLRHIPFMGELVAVADGVPNRCMLVGQVSLLLLVIFVADAAIAVWRRGNRRQAVIVGGSIVLFSLAGALQTALIVLGAIQWPVTASLFFMGVVAAMGYELSRDVLRAAQLARELRERNLQMTHVLRVASLGELSSSLAHELNQPLMAILTNAQAAQRFLDDASSDPQEIREILRDIVADDLRASEVIQRLRKLFKSGRFEPGPLEVNALLETVLKLMTHELTSNSVMVVPYFGVGLPMILGDDVQLQQVLINLVLNANDAMAHQGSAQRSLTLRSCRSAEGFVQISVADSGCGFPHGSEEKIFEPYHTTKPNGLGLGLSMSRTIVLAHGGRLWAENQARGGAVFYFTLPVWKDDAE